jgi:hypothetical protein
VYEQVSPMDKNGNEAGATTSPFDTGAGERYGYAAPSGEAVFFEGTGPMGESPWGDNVYFVASKDPGGAGWSTRALQPRGVHPAPLLSGGRDTYVYPSQDLTLALVEPANDPLAQVPSESCEGPLFLVGADPFVAGRYLEQPSPSLPDAVEGCGDNGAAGGPVGGSPDFSTVYFAFSGTLLSQDASRTPYAGAEAWGFYEYKEGVLGEAGVLPDGSVSPFGAVPAASGHGRNPAGNQVSEDGSRAFFVSPDPDSCKENGGQNDCATDPPELYVRVDGKSSLLVSADALLPKVGGLAAGAPDSVVRMPNRHQEYVKKLDGSYVFASPDGSQAFFQSDDALTEPAERASPGSEPKTYVFDVATGTVTYLPGVAGEVLATSRNGSAMAFMSPGGGGQPPQLEFWSAGLGGGSVTPVVGLSVSGSIPVARMSDDGSTLVFQTAQDLAGVFNTGGFEEIYRYDASTNSLGCVSCAPTGVTPRGNASMSMLHSNEIEALGSKERVAAGVDEGNVSANGERVFFESPDPLVPGDSNTNSPPAVESESEMEPQGRDVYEWENGVVYLISSGTSTRDSYLLDSSESGDDVFFATAQGLVAGDSDGGYDVYDARVPRPGETVVQSAGPCEGSSCEESREFEGPVAPASAGVAGSGNPAAEATVAPQSVKTPVKGVKCRRGHVKRKGKCVKRASKAARGARR